MTRRREGTEGEDGGMGGRREPLTYLSYARVLAVAIRIRCHDHFVCHNGHGREPLHLRQSFLCVLFLVATSVVS